MHTSQARQFSETHVWHQHTCKRSLACHLAVQATPWLQRNLFTVASAFTFLIPLETTAVFRLRSYRYNYVNARVQNLLRGLFLYLGTRGLCYCYLQLITEAKVGCKTWKDFKYVPFLASGLQRRDSPLQILNARSQVTGYKVTQAKQVVMNQRGQNQQKIIRDGRTPHSAKDKASPVFQKRGL